MSGPRGRNDLIGRRFGRLVAMAMAPSRGGQATWDCLCDCGATVNVIRHSLMRGATQSCGCFMKERSREEIVKRSRTHGKRHTPEYSVWCGMKRRCENPNEKTYPRYGGRGVEVRFQSFEEFLQEVGPRPTPDHTIDRKDAGGHYEPGNVRWATWTEQARNKRNSLIVSVNGRDYCLADACEAFGAPYKRTWARIKLQGWPPERALGLAA